MTSKISVMLLFVSIFVFSCSEDEIEKEALDFSVTGLEEEVSLKTGADEALTLNVNFKNEVEENVMLSLADVPEGVGCSLSKTAGTESYETTLEISVSEEAQAGDYQIKLIGTPEVGEAKVFTFTLEVIKQLSAKFEVYDATSWSPENTVFEKVANAEVILYQLSAEDTIEMISTTTTNDEGVVEIYNLEEGEYYFVVQTESLSSLTEQAEMEGIVYGYKVLGVYMSQEEIESGPEPNANVGDIKRADINGDGMISEDDRVPYSYWSYDGSSEPVNQTVYLGNKNP